MSLWTLGVFFFSHWRPLFHWPHLGNLYAVGGCDENNMRLNSVEKYNPSTDSWTFIPSMSACRSSPCVVADKFLYVIGGVSYVGKSCLSLVCVFLLACLLGCSSFVYLFVYLCLSLYLFVCLLYLFVLFRFGVCLFLLFFSVFFFVLRSF